METIVLCTVASLVTLAAGSLLAGVACVVLGVVAAYHAAGWGRA